MSAEQANGDGTNSNATASTPSYWPSSEKTYTLIRPPVLTRGLLLLILICTSVALTFVVPSIVKFGWTLDSIVMLLALLAICVGSVTVRIWKRPKQNPVIELHDTFVSLPKSPGTSTTYEVPYEDIRAIFRLERRDGEVVMIDLSKRLLMYSEAMFLAPYGPRSLWATLHTHIRMLPDGAQRIARMRELTQTAYQVGQRSLRMTWTLLGLVFAVFALQIITHALDHPFRLVEMGASAPSLVREGQWFRLFSANFLHGSWLHVILNGIALLFLGTVIERILGAWQFLLVFLFAALGGALASSIAAQGPMSVGTSTAIFGLLGSFAVVHLKYHAHLPPPFRQSRRWWIIILSINSALPLLVPQIDIAAHAGGFAAGAVLTALLLPGRGEVHEAGLRMPGWAKASCILLVAAFTLAFFQAVQYARNPAAEDMRIVLKDYKLRAQGDDGEVLNAIAWMIAIDTHATLDELTLAHEAVTSAIDIYSDFIPEYYDTLATVHYRLAEKTSAPESNLHIRKAVQTQHSIISTLQQDTHQIFWSQFTRFLGRHLRMQGVYSPKASPPLDVNLGIDAMPGQTRLRLTSSIPQSRHAEIHVLVVHERQTLGLVSICIGEQYSGAATYSIIEKFASLWPTHAEFVPAYIDTQSPACTTDDITWKLHHLSQDIRKLP